MTNILQQQQTALRFAEQRVRQHRDQAATAQRKHAVAEKDVARLKAEIAIIPGKITKATISEHAKLRYLERVLGIDVEAAIAAIDMTNANGAVAAGIANGRFFLPGGQTMVMQNNVIVTVKP